MKHVIEIRQTLTQKATPQTIQCIQLLSLPLVALAPYLRKMALENPLLELADYGSNELSENMESYELLSYQDRAADTAPASMGDARAGGENFLKFEAAPPFFESLAGLLRAQLLACGLPPRQERIGMAILRYISEDGYFIGSLQGVASQMGCTQQEARQVLSLIQAFSPKGVGAAGLMECLALQVEDDHPYRKTILSILQDDAEDLAQHRIAQMARKHGTSRTVVQTCIDYISRLNPCPGAEYRAPQAVPFMVSDVSIRKWQDYMDIQTRGRACEFLSINTQYVQMLTENGVDQEAKDYIKEKYRMAKSLMGSLDMRHSMLHRIAAYLAVYQEEYFAKGPLYLKPLTMKEAAAQIGIHHSTVCRAISGKYVETRWGIVPMHTFFSEGLAGEGGRLVSSSAVKEKIKLLLAGEDAMTPLSDQEIAQRLNKDGLQISRRTVSKYRQEANIPCQKMRRRYR